MSYLGRGSNLTRKAQDKVSFLATAGQTVRTGLSYVPTHVDVTVNGITLTEITDYTATNGNSITFTVALALNDEVTIVSSKTFDVANHYTISAANALLAAKLPLAGGTMTGNLVLSAANSQVGIGTDNMQIFNSVGGSSGLVVTGVSSSTAILGNTLSNITIANGDGTANNTAALHFAREDTDGNPNYAGASIVSQFKETQVTGQYPKADLAFLTSTSANSAPSEKMRIDSSGHAIIPAGVTLGTAAGVYSAANTLDDYEEGTFTGTASGVTATVQNTKYTKIGRLVYVTGHIICTANATADVSISGLPFAIAGSENGIGTAMNYNVNIAGGSTYNFVVYVQGSNIRFYRSEDNSPWLWAGAGTLNNGSQILFNVTYQTT